MEIQLLCTHNPLIALIYMKTNFEMPKTADYTNLAFNVKDGLVTHCAAFILLLFCI